MRTTGIWFWICFVFYVGTQVQNMCWHCQPFCIFISFLTDTITTSYSPDLALCVFFLFPKLKRPMKGRRFATIEELNTTSLEELKTIPKSAHQKGFEDWKKALAQVYYIWGGLLWSVQYKYWWTNTHLSTKIKIHLIFFTAYVYVMSISWWYTPSHSYQSVDQIRKKFWSGFAEIFYPLKYLLAGDIFFMIFY